MHTRSPARQRPRQSALARRRQPLDLHLRNPARQRPRQRALARRRQPLDLHTRSPARQRPRQSALARRGQPLDLQPRSPARQRPRQGIQTRVMQAAALLADRSRRRTRPKGSAANAHLGTAKTRGSMILRPGQRQTNITDRSVPILPQTGGCIARSASVDTMAAQTSDTVARCANSIGTRASSSLRNGVSSSSSTNSSRRWIRQICRRLSPRLRARFENSRAVCRSMFQIIPLARKILCCFNLAKFC